jgi:hypothetical protein
MIKEVKTPYEGALMQWTKGTLAAIRCGQATTATTPRQLQPIPAVTDADEPCKIERETTGNGVLVYLSL